MAHFRPRIMAVPLLIVALLLAVSPASAAPPAQTGTPIRYGQTLSGTITEDTACQPYWFEGRAGDTITIDMTRTSGSLDGVLRLYQRETTTAPPLAENDDRPGGKLDPLIRVTLPADDWYTIQACRLQHEQMRVTTGTYDLTLTGPAPAANPTPPASGGLSESVFPAGASPTPAPVAVPTSTPAPGGLFGGLHTPAPLEPLPLAIGAAAAGTITADAGTVYRFPASAGDVMAVDWQRTGGDAAPLLRIVDASGGLIASATTPDAVAALRLTFRVPDAGLFDDSTLALIVARSDETPGATAAYWLTVSIDTAAAGSGAAADSGTAPAPADYLANPCQSGADAITGLGSSARLIDVYTAAGDSYYADQLTRTTTFAQDDDLNVVFRVQNTTESLSVAGVFCPPSGSYLDAGADSFDAGGPYLLGLDWEYLSELWEPGAWFVEIYVDGALELSLGFTVE